MTTDRLVTDMVEKIAKSGEGRRLQVTAVRLLTQGEPITVDQLAGAAGIPQPNLAEAPAGSDIEYDDQGRIVGWGVTLNPTRHRFTVDGHQLYAFCGPDTLIIPAIMGRTIDVESEDPITGATIRLTVDPAAGVTNLDPAQAYVAFVDPERLDPRRVRATGCDIQPFFANAAAAHEWASRYPGMTVLPVAEAFPIAKSMADAWTAPEDR